MYCVLNITPHTVTFLLHLLIHILFASLSIFSAKLWNIATGECICSFFGHSGMYNYDMTGRGDYILSYSYRLQGFLTLLRDIVNRTGELTCVTKLRDKTFVTGSDDSTMRRWQINGDGANDNMDVDDSEEVSSTKKS